MSELDDLTDEEKEQLASAVKASFAFLLELAAEGQRSAVIIGAAKVEEQLEGLLKAVLVNNPKANDPLFASDRALGTLSAKIEIAYRLGLISADFRSALNLIRRIRNQFAHSVEFATLEDPPQGDRVEDLLNLCKQHPGLWSTGLAVGKVTSDPNMRAYCSCLMVVIGQLESARLSFPKVEVDGPISFDPPDLGDNEAEPNEPQDSA